MATTTVRLRERTRDVLRELAGETGQSMQEVLDRAVEAYRRERVLERTNAAYSALRADRARWEEEQAERAAWEVTLTDGLEP